jgi:hypothetical protein
MQCFRANRVEPLGDIVQQGASLGDGEAGELLGEPVAKRRIADKIAVPPAARRQGSARRTAKSRGLARSARDARDCSAFALKFAIGPTLALTGRPHPSCSAVRDLWACVSFATETALVFEARTGDVNQDLRGQCGFRRRDTTLRTAGNKSYQWPLPSHSAVLAEAQIWMRSALLPLRKAVSCGGARVAAVSQVSQGASLVPGAGSWCGSKRRGWGLLPFLNFISNSLYQRGQPFDYFSL